MFIRVAVIRKQDVKGNSVLAIYGARRQKKDDLLVWMHQNDIVDVAANLELPFHCQIRQNISVLNFFTEYPNKLKQQLWSIMTDEEKRTMAIEKMGI